jgi:hypothetical protein
MAPIQVQTGFTAQKNSPILCSVNKGARIFLKLLEQWFNIKMQFG